MKSSVVFKSANGLADESLQLAPGDMAWWKEAKIGMFIHWGLYAIPACGEWVMHNQKISVEDYAKLADQFVPKHFDAGRWAQIAKDAGMQYMVLTARHHDGYALWESPASYGGFCSTRKAAKRDFVAEYVAACRRTGIRVGIYYSPMDWRFPGYFNPVGLPGNAALMKQQGYGQVEELMRNYGRIDVLWYDGGWLAHKGTDADAAWFWEPLKLNAMVRKYQPKVVINPRSGWVGDFQCDEGGHRISGAIIGRPWEKCLNLNQASWGYNTSQNLMPLADILRMLINVVGRGGNMLLNVGPDPDGVIPEAHVERLRQVGDWLRVNGKGIYGTTAGPFQPVDQVCCTTFSGNRLYVHVLDWGGSRKLSLPFLKQRILSCSILSGEALRCDQSDGGIELTVLQPSGGSTPMVVELVLDSPAGEKA